MSAIEKFTQAFAPYGLPATAIKPSYGMAEATLSVASIAQDAQASAIYLDRGQLGAGRAVPVDAATPGAVSYVSCGQPIPNQWAVITDTDGAEVPDRRIGEIWLHGNNIGRGYFGREDETQRVFSNKLQSRLERGSHAQGPRTIVAGWQPAISACTSTASCTSRGGSKTSSSSTGATTTPTTSKPRSATLQPRSAPATSPPSLFPPTCSTRRAATTPANDWSSWPNVPRAQAGQILARS